MEELVGKLDSKGVKVGIVVGRFNELITERLLTGALETLSQNGVSSDDITVVRVPLAQTMDLIISGEIQDAKSVASLLLAMRRLN